MFGLRFSSLQNDFKGNMGHDRRLWRLITDRINSFRRNPFLWHGGKDQPGRGSRRFDPRSL